jgi:plastocyanin
MRIKLLSILALTALIVLAVACGDDDDDTGDGGNGGDGETDAATSAPAGNGDEADLTITVADFAFNPNEFTVPAGSDVVIAITNEDSTDHNFTVYTDAGFTNMQGTTLPLPAGASDSIFGTFPAGEYFFRCEIHPSQMQGSFTAE